MESSWAFEQNHLQRRVAELEAKESTWREVEDTALLLNAMVQSADDAIIGKTIKGIVQTWNPGAERLYGYPAAEMIGREMTVLLPTERRATKRLKSWNESGAVNGSSTSTPSACAKTDAWSTPPSRYRRLGQKTAMSLGPPTWRGTAPRAQNSNWPAPA